MRGAVQVVAFDEPELSSTLDAWVSQRVPPDVDVTYEAWITPAVEPRTQDPTWQQAADHPVFVPREAPKFKLPSRNVAHDAAISRGDDFVVSCDADTPPVHENVLTALTRPLEAPETVAVVGNPRPPLDSPAGLWVRLKQPLLRTTGNISGQCNLITAEGWRHAGPFEEDIDHTIHNIVWMEEEFRFGRRLRQIGAVPRARKAVVRHDLRREVCKMRRALQLPLDDYCERTTGTETMQPRQRYR